MFTQLIHNTKGIISLTQKITRCIHAISEILHADSVVTILLVDNSLHSFPYGRLPNFSIFWMPFCLRTKHNSLLKFNKHSVRTSTLLYIRIMLCGTIVLCTTGFHSLLWAFSESVALPRGKRTQWIRGYVFVCALFLQWGNVHKGNHGSSLFTNLNWFE